MSQIMREEIEPQFTAGDVRQHVWCPRKTYVHYVLKYRGSITLKMQKGHERHEKHKKKPLPSQVEGQGEQMLDQNGLPEKETSRYHNIYLKSENFGLRGVIDTLVLLSDDKAMPINIKTGSYAKKAVLPADYKAQLVAEALLIESTTPYKVTQAAIQSDKAPLRTVEITPEDKLWVLGMLRQMREIVQTEIMPVPTPYPAKCVDCEALPACKRS